MKRPIVTPIFPPRNGLEEPQIPKNLPIRNLESSENILNAGGYRPTDPPFVVRTDHQWSPPRLKPEFSCINIAQHIDTCPICSRLYDTDKTLYILAIIGLLILCFLMAKRIVKL